MSSSMSGIRCLRSAFDACRPARALHIPPRANPQWRSYADVAEKSGSSVVSRKASQKSSTNNESPHLDSLKTVEASTASDISTAPAVIGATPPHNETAAQTKAERRPIPANVVAAYRAPLKHDAPYGVPVASLQLRSYSVRNLEFFADFALRAAYYLNLPASGPVPLPKRIERWTMPKANFVHKKTQENFERITYKRLITITDGEKSAVEVWLAVLRKWQFYGVGMKANVWEWEGVDVAAKMDAQAKDLEAEIDAKLANFGFSKDAAKSQSVDSLLRKQGVKAVGVPMTEVREGAQRRQSEV